MPRKKQDPKPELSPSEAAGVVAQEKGDTPTDTITATGSQGDAKPIVGGQEVVSHPLLPSRRREPLSAVLLIVSMVLAGVCAGLSWYLLQPSAHTTAVQNYRVRDQEKQVAPQATLAPLVREVQILDVAPTITADPGSLGKPNPFGR